MLIARQLSVSQRLTKKEMTGCWRDLIPRLIRYNVQLPQPCPQTTPVEQLPHVIPGYSQFSCLGLISIVVPTVLCFFVSLSLMLSYMLTLSYIPWPIIILCRCSTRNIQMAISYVSHIIMCTCNGMQCTEYALYRALYFHKWLYVYNRVACSFLWKHPTVTMVILDVWVQ